VILGADIGGQQSVMRDTVWTDATGALRPQKMVLPDGTPKGMRLVLHERGLLTKDMVAETMRETLSQQKDFKEQKCLIAEIIEARGHRCLFLPRFHPEFNPIELDWSSSKRFCRDHWL